MALGVGCSDADGDSNDNHNKSDAADASESRDTQDAREADNSCDDALKNGDETDVDCGGATCEPCALGLQCERAGDCESGVCTGVSARRLRVRWRAARMSVKPATKALACSRV